MRGPNYWSVNRHKLIVMVLDLEELEERPTDKIEGFAKRMMDMFPSLMSHRCSVGTEGGFLERVNLRFDIAQPVYGAKGGPLFWFGFNQVF